jgi:hypothetical protein
MKTEKTYTIKTSRSGRSIDGVRENTQTGTLSELISYFSYTLEIGNSWNKKIKRNPTTINSFVKNLQMSYEEKESSCYDRTSVSLV